MHPYKRKYNQFRRLSGELNELLTTGKFYQLSRKHQHQLISKLRELFYRLIHVFSEFRLEKILAGAALLIGISTSQNASAQNFGVVQNQPFSIQIAPYTYGLGFADLDNDGDNDLLMVNYGGSFLYQENIGTPQTPSFKDTIANPFNLAPLGSYAFASLAFADLDNDGDFDLVVMESYYGNMLYFENTGNSQTPNFAAPITNPSGFVPSYYYIFPSFVDMDDDGDQDLWMGGYGYNSRIAYFENIGTPQQPLWDTIQFNPFNFTFPAKTLYPAPSLADLDHDGDLDLLTISLYYDSYTNYGSHIYYHENLGTTQVPNFSGGAQIDPFNLFVPHPGTTNLGFPKFVDLDDDGDFDLACHTISYSANTIYYFENMTVMPGIQTAETHKPFVLYPNPTSNQLIIKLEDANDPLPVSLVNSLGQTIFHGIIHQREMTILLDDFPNGTYLVRIGNHSETVIKQ